jgi:hypothetical protein
MRKLLFPIFAGVLLLAGCSETTPTAETKKEAKPPEPVTGETALDRMFRVARSWAPDAQVLQMNSIMLSEVANVRPGTGAAWQATFVSPSTSQARSYTYSIVEAQGNLHEGVFPGQQESYNPHGTNAPFPIGSVKVDTSTAYKTALENGGADYDKKTPGKPISFLLEKVEKYPDPVWRVIWGESVGTSNFSVYVDATSGKFLEKLH